MLFADNIALVRKSPKEGNGRHKEWWISLEGKILTIRRNKTKYIKYNFGRKEFEARKVNGK